MNPKKNTINFVKKLFWLIIESTPLWVWQSIFRRNVIGLTYHLVSDERLSHVEHLFEYKSIAQFEHDLIYLKKHHHLISFNDLLSRKQIEHNSMLLTFDDGYRELFSVVGPLLAKHSIPAIFFITTDLIDNKTIFFRNEISLCIGAIQALNKADQSIVISKVNKQLQLELKTISELTAVVRSLRHQDSKLLMNISGLLNLNIDDFLKCKRPYLSTDEIRSLCKAGITIGGHTKSHTELSLLSEANEIENEILESCRIISENTNEQYVPFAFPFSGDGVDKEIKRNIVNKNRFIPYLFEGGRLRLTDDYIVNRINLDSSKFASPNESNVKALLLEEYRSYAKWLSKQLICD